MMSFVYIEEPFSVSAGQYLTKTDDQKLHLLLFVYFCSPNFMSRGFENKQIKESQLTKHQLQIKHRRIYE